MSTLPERRQAVEPLPAKSVSYTLAYGLLSGDGEVAELMRHTDWSHTPLGPQDQWSQSLRSAISICLGSRFPIVIYWGAEFVVLYNDAYARILAGKHPQALGRPCREVWAEIWDVIEPMLQGVVATGEATWSDDQLLILRRHGYPEECYFSFSFSPVRAEDNSVGGVFTAVIEHTQQVLGERRLAALRDLGATGTGARTAQDACAIAAETLSEHGKDIPFALLYLLDRDGDVARLAGAAGVAAGDRVSPPVIGLGAGSSDGQSWPLAEAVRSNVIQVVENLACRFGAAVPPGPWPDSPRQAVLVPIRSNMPHQIAGILVAGVSARLGLDDSYRNFYDLAASQIANAIAKARAYEEERKRAEALAEIDRAKTRFFSNVSHEFRTPLTLMLGPLEDLLSDGQSDLSPARRAQLEVVHRNGLRLLKLVNTMLDFSRIEAGRVQASYHATDLAVLTAELASNFRSACEKAGLELVVDCPPFAASEPAYVDRDMWEKIVLNLVSNAFKFTLEGRIEVRLAAIDGEARLTVRDSGVGIPAQELPRLFERFHRIEQSGGRTYEGSGIGLALAQELVKLHGGTVHVESAPGKGSTFTVAIPLGSSHLDPERIGKESGLASTGITASAYVEEALRWLPGEDRSARDQTFAPSLEAYSGDIPPVRNDDHRARIVWADDNADMRHYVGRLLEARFDVIAVPDGEAALEAARANPPDLVLSDAMMPRLDGFGLLRALRADPRLRDVPVILLSARAGEEARIEGAEAGADDYLIKPFSARELIARVETQAKMARTRRESEERVRQANAELASRVAELQDARRAALNIMEDADEARQRAEALNAQLRHEMAEREKAERASGRLAAIVDSSHDAIVSKDLNGIIATWNRGAERLFGYAAEEVIGKPITILIPADRQSEEPAILDRIRRGERVETYETVRMRKDGTLVDISLAVSPVRDRSGKVIGASKIARDITERKQAQARQELLTREIQHRTKNLFAVVRAVVGRSFAGKQTVEEAEAAVVSRLQSLSQTHVMLMDKQWEGLDLAEVVSAEMSPYAGRVKIEGPKLTLNPKAAQNFSLAVHELATNAAKYGALSNATGWVHISWSVSPHNGLGACVFHWQEHGGPAVSAPVHKGFGSTVLEYVMAEYFDQPPRMEFAPSGLNYTLTALVQAITPTEQAHAWQGDGNATSSEGSRGPVHPDH